MTDAKKATHPGELERQIMDANVPKNEREWWASKEILRLRGMVAADCNLMVEWSKKVTQAKDMADSLTAERDALIKDLEDAWRVNREKEDQLVAITGDLAEQREIVSRVWVILGSPTYEELAGRSIYDLIQSLITDAARVESLFEAEARKAFILSERVAFLERSLQVPVESKAEKATEHGI